MLLARVNIARLKANELLILKLRNAVSCKKIGYFMKDFVNQLDKETRKVDFDSFDISVKELVSMTD